MSKKKKIAKGLDLINEMPQPERSIFLNKLLIACGMVASKIIKPK